MTPSDIRLALETVGGTPNKRLGQHFLIDRAALEAVMDGAHVQTGDKILEIGPGLGVLTKALLARGAHVQAIEKDRRFSAWLTSQAWAINLSICEGDAIAVDWAPLMGERPWKLVANLPYAVTSFVLRLALFAQHPPTHVSVLVQREVAERALDPKKTSLLSLMVGLSIASGRIVRRVPPGAFFPPPKVDSAVLALEVLPWDARVTRWGLHPERVMFWAKRGFAHPRKRLASNLSLAESVWEQVRAGIVDNPHIRAEALSVEAWAALAKRLETLENQAI